MSPDIWHRMCDAIEDPIFLHDPDYRVRFANHAYFKAAGMTPAEAVGKFYWEVFPRGDGPLPGCRATHEGGRSESSEEFTAGERRFLSRGFEVRDAQGTAQYSLHVLRDITAQRQAEDHVARIQRLYRTISRCNQVLVRAEDELALSGEMCRVLVEHGEFKSACAMLGPRAGHVVPAGWAGLNVEEARLVAEVGAQRAESIERDILGQGRPDLRRLEDENDPLLIETMTRLGVAASAALPFAANGDRLGVLWVGSERADCFAEDVIDLLTELVGDLAYGITNLRGRAERLGILEKLDHSLDHAVAAIAATVEMRDPYTAGHQRRVAQLAAAIATEMGLPGEQVDGLRMAGIVHDIGKVRVPAEILASPAKLSDAEFAIIRTHPLSGWEILKVIDFPWPVAEIVHQHHERLDGSGYPRGLKGEEILLEARILAVADVVEAMATHRPYRPGFGVFPALQEVTRNKGRFFDPAVVEACLRLFMERGYEL
ncbi:HD domain-containing phosphohydrolase [Sulfuricystis thermophila]|uniref:HD domain-containing phosphohydrolase n=1 Tax=Sulfuricystis thermophila TaxID=2496847 RepID=UPI001558B913|nr:HD domain-containing phosphohydrolase [Sulfuricystis thermophila]